MEDDVEITVDEVFAEALAQHNAKLGQEIAEGEAANLVRTGLVNLARYMLIVRSAPGSDDETSEIVAQTIEDMVSELCDRVAETTIITSKDRSNDA